MKNSTKGFVPLVLLIIIAIAAIGGGTYVYTKHKEAAQKSIHSTATTTAEVSDNQSPEATEKSQNAEKNSDWKTYSNTQLGFQFQYPSDWQIVNDTSDVVIVKVVDSKTPVKDGTDQTSNMFLVRTIGDLDLNHLDAGTLKADEGWQTGFGGIPWRSVYYKDRNINVVMSAATDDSKTIENKIFATFKFTTPGNSASKNQGFSAASLSGNAPFTVQFTNTLKSAGNISIDYGDGTSCSTADPSGPNKCSLYTHTYVKAGTYTAILYRHLPTTELARLTITVK